MQYDVSSSRLQTWSSSKCRNSNRTSQTNCLMDSTAELSYLPQEFNWCTLTVGVWLLTLFAIPRGRLRSLAWILRSKSKYSDSSKSKSYSPNLWSPVSPTRGANLLPVLPEPQRTRKLHSSRKLQPQLSSLISTTAPHFPGCCHVTSLLFWSRLRSNKLPPRRKCRPWHRHPK